MKGHQPFYAQVNFSETHRAFKAPQKADPAKVCDELGDILLQVLLHAQISAEAGEFDIGDVIHGLPVLCALRDRFPEAHLSWVVERTAATLLKDHPALDELVVTDTIPLSPEARRCARIRQLSSAPLLAEAVRRVSNEESISAMFA